MEDYSTLECLYCTKTIVTGETGCMCFVELTNDTDIGSLFGSGGMSREDNKRSRPNNTRIIDRPIAEVKVDLAKHQVYLDELVAGDDESAEMKRKISACHLFS